MARVRCWREAQAEGQPRAVCVIASGAGRWDIEVRYATEAGRRLTQYCAAPVPDRRLSIALRMLSIAYDY